MIAASSPLHAALRGSPALRKRVKPRLTRYIPNRPTPKQRAAMCLNHIRELFYGGALGGGKSDWLLMEALQYPLALDTPVPTVDGWATIGSLEVGDVVFDESGNQCRVTGKTGVSTSGDRYRITFKDGESIVADGNHLWPADTFADRMSIGRGAEIPVRFVTTREMYRTRLTNHRNKPARNWSVRNSGPIDLDEAELPVDPYILGVWLGDGHKRDGGIAGVDPETREYFRQAGYEITCDQEDRFYAPGLRSELESLGVREDKHVPPQYLRGSKRQRLELIRGLMDTDGTNDSRWGTPSFSNCNLRIIDAFEELARSMGWQTRRYRHDYKTEVSGRSGTIYKVTVVADQEVFRLPRKIEKQKQSIERKNSGRSHAFQIVESIERINEPVPVQCISVDSPNHLFLVGKNFTPTHNCDIPDYNALILRRTLADANKASSIMFRARKWLSGTDAKSEGSTWRFPSGAVLEFGGIDKRNDHFKFDGSEYSFIAADEFTKMNYEQVRYVMTTRLRKPGCSIHKDIRVADCRYCADYMHTNLFPLRLRAASNPGGMSHIQVKNRYDIGPVPGKVGPMGYQLYAGRNPDRPHIPAFIQDNPYLDAEDYIQQLRADLGDDAVTLRQMMAGDWGVTPESRFKRQWIRRYEFQGHSSIHLGNGRVYDLSQCHQIVVVDPASSNKDSPGKTELDTNKQASYSVVSRWLVTPAGDLCLLHVRRFQKEMPEIIREIREEVREGGNVRAVCMEFTTQSTHLYQACRRTGLPMKAMTTGGRDKVARATDATIRMEGGQILLPPLGPRWLTDFEDEVFTWTGAKHETDDQVDVVAYAAIHVTQSHSRIAATTPPVLS